jgi:hypothetical protein
MYYLSGIIKVASAIREFLVPSYRPERHYMRGPGPACARRASRNGGGEASFG